MLPEISKKKILQRDMYHITCALNLITGLICKSQTALLNQLRLKMNSTQPR